MISHTIRFRRWLFCSYWKNLNTLNKLEAKKNEMSNNVYLIVINMISYIKSYWCPVIFNWHSCTHSHIRKAECQIVLILYFIYCSTNMYYIFCSVFIRPLASISMEIFALSMRWVQSPSSLLYAKHRKAWCEKCLNNFASLAIFIGLNFFTCHIFTDCHLHIGQARLSVQNRKTLSL